MWNKLTLIVGPKRSGTTWLGKMLSIPSYVEYLDEPDAPRNHPESEIEIAMPVWNLRDLVTDPHEGYWEWMKVKLMDYTRYLVDMYFDPPIDHLIIKTTTVDFFNRFIEMYEPDNTLYITRHPMGVYNSYQHQGWEGTFLREWIQVSIGNAHRYGTMQTVTNPMGRAMWLTYAREEYAKRTLKNYGGTMVQYERLCMFPKVEYRKLYDYLDIQWNEYIWDQMQPMIAPGNPETSRRGVRKNSEERAWAWHKELIRESQQMALDFCRKHELPYEWGFWHLT